MFRRKAAQRGAPEAKFAQYPHPPPGGFFWDLVACRYGGHDKGYNTHKMAHQAQSSASNLWAHARFGLFWHRFVFQRFFRKIGAAPSLDVGVQPGLRRLDAMTVGQRLEQVRASMGLTQAEIAAQSGVPLRTYSSYATGKRQPSNDLLEWIARRGYSINWLLTGSGAMQTGESIIDPTCGSGAFLLNAFAVLDAELNGRINEVVTTVYAECGAKIGPRDMGRVTAEIYNEIAAAGLESWEEKMGALRLAAGQLRRRLLAAPSPNPTSDEGKRLA
ncbi:helix-turn-helix domain-containing protein [Paramagnetospirillum magneticum]|uniref:helix-turn-helix domain-containing protein n=1 Tax=Paramagnetospirillum magneticum TaxID=84159 RepID=UPI001E2D2781|nr:helix-turn-helix transcriptional regulator [Paramagnetospirillum magneticum]